MSLRVFGLMIVRNEADILRTNLRHHLALGMEQFLIADNGSTDGTILALREMAKTGRVQWISEPGPFHQEKITNRLAWEAYLRGADWVIPIDADEFWYAPEGDFLQTLRESRAGALRTRIANFVQRRDQIDRSADALLHMTWRSPEPVGPVERIEDLVATRQIGFVEILYPPKCIARASPALEIGVGNHSVRHATGPVEDTDRIVCLHAPLRSRSVLEAQADHGRRTEQAGNRRAWHVQRWMSVIEHGDLEREWRANSYEDGALDVDGVHRPLVFDSRLRDLVKPWIQSPALTGTEPSVQEFSPTFTLEDPLASGMVRSILERMEPIEGWMPVPEACALMATAAVSLMEKEPQPAVEIGSYCGRSTSVLAGTVQQVCPGMKVYAIDPHEGELTSFGNEVRREAPTWERFAQIIEDANLSDVVVPIRKRSIEVAWDRPIGFLFIDGLHDYANVSRDFHHFDKWVVPGGYVAFDDYDSAFPGVIQFANEILARGDFRRFLRVGKMLVLEKRPVDESTDESGRTQESPPEMGGRLRRYERGVVFLKQVLREHTRSTEAALAERDRIIVGLQAEIHEKVAVRDRMIRDLQTELHAKVAERDQMIRALQAEMQKKVDECNRVIEALQMRLRQAQ